MGYVDTFTGYDGREYAIGDRVELHPGTDLWMHGARYGVVVAREGTGRARVKLDKLPEKRFHGSEDTFRKLPPTELERILEAHYSESI